MRLFRKKHLSAPVHPISAFWEWWEREGRTLDPRNQSPVIDELSQRVAAIHPDLTWHFGAGSASEHRLTVSANGTAEVRPAAQRWLRAAPLPNSTWEFRSSQEADPNALNKMLEIAGSTIDLSKTEFRVETGEQELRVHVGVYHPAFRDLPEFTRLQVSFLVLDWLLGEDDVERWLGPIEALTAPSADYTHGEGVLRAVDKIAKDQDPEAWTLSRWEAADGTPAFASFRSSLHWIDHPTLDLHHGIHASFVSQDNGLPVDGAALDSLQRLEDELEAKLGPSGLVIGHETAAGRRIFHVYTDGEDQNIAAGLTEWVRAHHLSIESAPDPAWRRVRQFTG